MEKIYHLGYQPFLLSSLQPANQGVFHLINYQN